MVQVSIAVFLLGFSLGPLIFGPLSDAFGRRKLIYSSLLLFRVFSILCSISFNIYLLIIFRFFQAVFGSVSSVCGRAAIADILSGEGIRFDEFEMNFQNQGDIMTIDEIYAIGPAISILMSGYVEDDKLISLRGTLVPATTINKTISSIPVLGKILVGDKTGEAVSYTHLTLPTNREV